MIKCLCDYELTLREVMSVLIDPNNIDYNRITAKVFKAENKLSYSFKTILTKAYAFDFTDQNDAGIKALPFFEYDNDLHSFEYKDPFVTLLDYIFTEYSESYCVRSPEEETISIYSDLFLNEFVTKLIALWDKYSNLYKYYQDSENNLLNAIKSSYEDYSAASGSTNNTNINKFKDTPQSDVDIEDLGDDYNSNVSINQGETGFSNSGSVAHTAYDERDSLVERLHEIELKMSNILDRFAKEFTDFFWFN